MCVNIMVPLIFLKKLIFIYCLEEKNKQIEWHENFGKRAKNNQFVRAHNCEKMHFLCALGAHSAKSATWKSRAGHSILR